MGHRFDFVKDTIIQIIFIIFALVLTVTAAYVSISDQYTAYYEAKLIEKAANLAHDASVMLTLAYASAEEADIERVLDLAFSVSALENTEEIGYALYDANGQIVVAYDMPVKPGPIPDAAYDYHEAYTEVTGARINAYCPVEISGRVVYILRVQADYSPFLRFGEDVRTSLYTALFRGCLMMVVTFALFSVYSNLRGKKKAPTATPRTEETGGFATLFKVQVISLLAFLALSAPCWVIFSMTGGLLRWTMLALAALLSLLAAAHLFRLLSWLLLWYASRPMSAYTSQTMQFCVFLVVFLAIFGYSVQNSFNARILTSQQDELRQSSVFAALTLGQTGEDARTLAERVQSFRFGNDNRCLIIEPAAGSYRIIGAEEENISDGQSLLDEAWDARVPMTGVFNGYLYGITPVFDGQNDIIALLALRRPYALITEELQSDTVDFLLGMSATVLAFVFLFIELNKLLESLSVTGSGTRVSVPALRYATGARSLIFLATLCQYIPLYFFVLIVQRIYEDNPVSWLSSDLAKTFPLALVLPIVLFGSNIVGRLLKVNERLSMILGCAIGAGGFLLIGIADDFWIYLIMLLVTYTGISMVYNGLWGYVGFAAEFSDQHPELSNLTESSRGGEYVGYTAGAVLGAMAFDKFGLFAALLLSAGVLLILGVLIRCMLPRDMEEAEDNEEAEAADADAFDAKAVDPDTVDVSAGNSGMVDSGTIDASAGNLYAVDSSVADANTEVKHPFWRFVTSKRVIFYILTLILPFTAAPYFIDQFSPMYAESIQLSPSAVSWTSLLQVLCIAYITPPLCRRLSVRFSQGGIAVASNLLVAVALFIFAFWPGVPTLYIASVLIGMSLGLGAVAMNDGFLSLKESESFEGSESAYSIVELAGGQLGTVLFTVAYTISTNGEFMFVIAALVLVGALFYALGILRKPAG